jgi:hypothetical protein
MALVEFRSPDVTSRWNGLCHLVDAHERIKASRVEGNKKKSVAAIVAELSPELELASYFDAR